MKDDIRVVHENWLWQRAKALETKLLKKYGQSLARISICNRFNRCVKCASFAKIQTKLKQQKRRIRKI